MTAAVQEQLDYAQSQIDRHTAASGNGRCLACGEEDPCSLRLVAAHVFTRYGRLPRRAPGTSRPEQVGTPKAWSGWLNGSTGASDSTG
ncbi:hypothetical protein [Actinoplanes derwentensis]|uniref:hypothetical protein n=1 Tax=Actinoplanes derwentensis TaxID=113562 RepID=UPI0012FDB3AF|nr:hypothetical protein [Actinoplanes derwentensis]